MEKRRLKLHEILKGLIGSENVYFRPPSSGMDYPCYKYNVVGDAPKHADNQIYQYKYRWTITAIVEDADSDIPQRLLQLPYCSFDREYEADGLNHFVYTLYF